MESEACSLCVLASLAQYHVIAYSCGLSVSMAGVVFHCVSML